MQRRRVMKLYHKARHRHGPILAASMVRMTRTLPMTRPRIA
jgi:hypothetical protein